MFRWLRLAGIGLLLLSACQPAPPPATNSGLPFTPAPQAIQASPTPPKLDLPSTTASPSPAPALLENMPLPTLLPSPSPTASQFTYITQVGDTLAAVARRFNINPASIASPQPIPPTSLLAVGQQLTLPGKLAEQPSAQPLLPDSEVIFSPSAVNFDIESYLKNADGFMSTHREYLRSTGWTTAADVIQRVAVEYSINPRLLVSLLEYNCNCVRGPLNEAVDPEFLLGIEGYRNKGLYRQLEWAANTLSAGYYGWRIGDPIPLQSEGDRIAPPPPGLNAGSAALWHYFAARYADQPDAQALWQAAVDLQQGLPALHTELFGDPWQRSAAAGPHLPAGLSQPTMRLPFEPGVLWSYTSGPHAAWGTAGALAALDFAPAAPISGCIQTDAWVVAVADGLVTRSAFGVVAQDIYRGASGQAEDVPVDGVEHTGWAVIYLHIADQGRVEPGTFLRSGERIGHPSCEGGRANGTHLHIARKYNGEWMPADGPVPFVLDGWVAHAGDAPYQGTLTRDGQMVVAHPYGSYETRISIPTSQP